MNELNVFVPIKKVDVAQRLVYGQLAAEVPDHSGEIMDYETSAPNWKTWSAEIHKVTDGKSAGNVRSMHTNIAAGKLTDISFDDATKSIMGCAKIVDDNEWNKVLEGVYTGFSMGGKYVKRWADPSNPTLKRYTASVHEVSLVDSPCIPTALFFDVVKADGSTEMRKFKIVKEADADLKQVWLAKDGSTHDKKADALQKNLDFAVTTAVSVTETAMQALQKAKDALAAKEDPAGEDATVEAEATKVEAPADLTKADDATVAAVKAEKTDAEKADAFAKAVSKAVLAKQLCDIPQVVSVISSLQWLQSDLEWDTLFDDAEVSTLPADLKAILASLCNFLKAMVEDATADIAAESDAAKALTFDQVDTLRKFTGKDLLPDVKAPEVTKVDHTEEMTKIQGQLELSKAREAALEKTVGDLTSGIGDLTTRISKLEAQPLPAKGHKSVTVTKGHEGAASGADELPDEALIAKFAHLPPEQARAKFKEAKAKSGQ